MREFQPLRDALLGQAPSKRLPLNVIQRQGPGQVLPDDVSADWVGYVVSVKLDVTSEELFITDEVAYLGSSIIHEKQGPILTRSRNVLELWSESTAETFRRDQHDNYSGLMTLPDDRLFPATTWLRKFLQYGIRAVALNPADLAAPSPPTGGTKRITGANLARQVARLNDEYPLQSQDWLAHVRTALPDVRKIDSVLREEDKHRYVVIEYENGVRVPSWMLSEGTLRLLALTIFAYLPDPAPGVYLIEEPENGVHPTALETIYQSLSSVPNAQVLVASHSPVLLSMARPEQILCFSKTAEGTRIVRGNEHPALQEWRGEVSLGTLAASGILG